MLPILQKITELKHLCVCLVAFVVFAVGASGAAVAQEEDEPQNASQQAAQDPQQDAPPVMDDSAFSAGATDTGTPAVVDLKRPALTVKQALDKIPAGGVNAAIKDLTRLGYKGDGNAFFHLAEIYRLGVGREPAPDVSVMYYRLAAAQGHKQAELNLANLLYFDIGDIESRERALDIWKAATLAGELEAMYLYGLALWNGEAIGTSDPIRGYGLVARAADAGYSAAINTELEMRTQISFEARERGVEFAEDLSEDSFSSEPLDLDLVFAGLETESGRSDQPDDWAKVWRVEVGFSLNDMDSMYLQAEIMKQLPAFASRYAVTRIPARSNPDNWRLLYGPMSDAVEAASFCARLRRMGEDCFARAPEDGGQGGG